MKLIDKLKNFFFNRNKYKTHSEGVIITTYKHDNKNNSNLSRFAGFYTSIIHMNHRIIEFVLVGDEPKIEKTDSVEHVYYYDFETIIPEEYINETVRKLPSVFKYIFWLESEIHFSNKRWMLDAIENLQPLKYRLVQLFSTYKSRTVMVQESFGSNLINESLYPGNPNFAWGARRAVFNGIGLFENIRPFSSNYLLAHAASGNILKYPENYPFIYFEGDLEWVEKCRRVVGEKVGYVKGSIYRHE